MPASTWMGTVVFYKWQAAYFWPVEVACRMQMMEGQGMPFIIHAENTGPASIWVSGSQNGTWRARRGTADDVPDWSPQLGTTGAKKVWLITCSGTQERNPLWLLPFSSVIKSHFQIFKVYYDFLSLYWTCNNIAPVLSFGFFGQEACGILVPWPGIEPTPPAEEGKVLTTGPPEKSQFIFV